MSEGARRQRATRVETPALDGVTASAAAGLRVSVLMPIPRSLGSVPDARAAAFFDLDKTIIAKSSVLAFGKPLYREGLLSRRSIVKSAYAQVIFMLVGADEAKMEKLRTAMLEMIRGWNRDHVAEIVRETLDEIVTPIIFAEALDLIAEHQAAGRKVVIVSSAPEEVVRPLGEFLGVDDVIATRADRSTRTATTPASSRSTATARTKPRRWRPWQAAKASASPSRTRTATRSPTSRCSEPSVIHSPSIPTRSWRASRGRPNGRSSTSKRPIRLRDRMPGASERADDRRRRSARCRGRECGRVVVAPAPPRCGLTKRRVTNCVLARSGPAHRRAQTTRTIVDDAAFRPRGTSARLRRR